MRLTPEQIMAQIEAIIQVMNEPVSHENPHAVMSKLAKLGNIIGNSSVCSSSAEYYYQTNKKEATYHELKVLCETVNKDCHYLFTLYQSILSFLRQELNKTII